MELPGPGKLSCLKINPIRSELDKSVENSKNKNLRRLFLHLTFAKGWQNLTEAPRKLLFLKKDFDGHTLKVRQSQDLLNKM